MTEQVIETVGERLAAAQPSVRVSLTEQRIGNEAVGQDSRKSHASFWGQGSLVRIEGREDNLSLDGELATGIVGADWTRARWTLGLSVAHSCGEGDYQDESDSVTVEAMLTGVYPYGRYEMNESMTFPGIAGYGYGTLDLTPETGGLELAAASGAMAVHTTSAVARTDADYLGASETEVTRLRLGLEGTWYGLDLGRGDLAWRHAASGIEVEVSGQGVLTHEESGFRGRGVADSLTWDPRPKTERRLMLMLNQMIGAQAAGGMDELFGRTTNDDGNELQNRRVELQFGYGFPAFYGRSMSTPEIEFGFTNRACDYSLGWRLTLARSGANTLELGVVATRRKHANDYATEHVIGFRLTARWWGPSTMTGSPSSMSIHTLRLHSDCKVRSGRKMWTLVCADRTNRSAKALSR